MVTLGYDVKSNVAKKDVFSMNVLLETALSGS